MKRLYILFALLLCMLYKDVLCQAAPKYEFRAVWVATVENIDWPAKRNLSVQEQKDAFIRMLDMHKRNGMNTIIMQVRPAADAFYPSQFEPWSEYLNGKQGLAPVPYYDPLQFMIEETHKRGMEFHAWLNPYRAVFNIQKSSIAPNHITRLHPDWFLTYGNKKYFDPGKPEVMKYVTNIVKDLVTRYDVDGIHMDDYFYPYKIPGKEFPDYNSFATYNRGLSKAEWRRSNCDSIIKMIHDTIINTAPMVKFGVSPFGVWRNKSQDENGSETRAGVTNYDDLYADILLWLQKGWIDYVAPQLYWEIGHPVCDFETLVNWWANHSYGKHVYIGQGIYRFFNKPSKAWLNPNEIPEEISLIRETSNIQGSAFYSSSIFERNPNGWSDSLRLNYYKSPALIPPMPWIDTTAPKQPTIATQSISKNVLNITCHAADSAETETVKSYVLYLSDDAQTISKTPSFILPAASKNFSFTVPLAQIPAGWHNCFVAVTSVDKENNESHISNVVECINTNKGWVLKTKDADIFEASVGK